MEAARERPERPTPPRTSDTSPVEAQTQIKKYHDDGHKFIQQGLTCDEQGQTEQALTLYTNGLRCIDRALDIPCPQNESVVRMVEKMKRTKQQIQSRVGTLIQSDAAVARAMDDPPPSYENATTPSSEFDFLYDEESSVYGSMVADAQEVFKIQEGVQIFYISPEGYVSAPSYPASLCIYKFTEEQQAAARNTDIPPAFLRVGDWIYPLVPGQSPVLHANYGAYVFPDVSSDTPGTAVGLIIPEGITAQAKNTLDSTLSSLTAMRTQTPSSSMEQIATRQSERVAPQPSERVAPPRPSIRPTLPQERHEPPRERVEPTEERTSTKISKGIVTAAEWISWGLGKGAEKAGQLMRAGSAKLKEQLNPEAQPRNIDPRAQKGLAYARTATGVAVKVSGYIVSKLSEATVALGKELAPHIRKHGEKLLPENMRSEHSKDGRSKIDDAVEVAAGGLHGFGMVYMGLESAAKSLFKNLADETVQVVKHKYGTEAGQLTDNTLYTAGNAMLAGHNIRNLGVKAIAKRAAKDTGKAVVIDYAKERKMHDKDAPGPSSGKM